MLHNKFLAGLLGLLLVSTSSQAKDRPFIDEPDNTIRDDFTEREWQESEFSLPDRYVEENLQEFQVDTSSSNFRYFIDADSLRSTADGVSRFILVIRSSSGVDNSSYEGIRCGEREYRVYAYGGKQGFKRLPGSEWKHISKSGRDNYRDTLYNDLICNSNTGQANPPEAVLRAMRSDHKVPKSLFFQD